MKSGDISLDHAKRFAYDEYMESNKSRTNRRRTTRIYSTSNGQFVIIEKEWEIKFGAYLYYLWAWPKQIPGTPLGRYPSFHEALSVAREMRVANKQKGN